MLDSVFYSLWYCCVQSPALLSPPHPLLPMKPYTYRACVYCDERTAVLACAGTFLSWLMNSALVYYYMQHLNAHTNM